MSKVDCFWCTILAFKMKEGSANSISNVTYILVTSSYISLWISFCLHIHLYRMQLRGYIA